MLTIKIRMLSNVREIQSSYPKKQRERNYIFWLPLQTRIANQHSLLMVNHMNLKYLITPVSTDNGDIKVSATVIFATLRSLTSVLIDTLKKGMTPISTHICINWVSSFPKRHTHWYFLKMRISQYSLLLYPTTILTTLAQLMKCGHCHWKSLNDKITTL